MPDARGDRGEHRRLEREQPRRLVEEPAPVLAQADGTVRDAEFARHLPRRDRRADEVVDAPAVRCGVRRHHRRGLGQVLPRHRGQGAVPERGLHIVTRPHQQTAEEFGVQAVAQDRPRQPARPHEPLGRAVGQSETEVIAGGGQARVDDVADAVADGGVQDRRVPGDDLVVLGVAGGDEHQGRHAGEVEARTGVEVEAPHPLARRAAAARRNGATGVQRRKSGRAEVPVRSGHQNHDQSRSSAVVPISN